MNNNFVNSKKLILVPFLILSFFVGGLFTTPTYANVFSIQQASLFTGFVDYMGNVDLETFVEFEEKGKYRQGIIGNRLDRLVLMNHTETETWSVNMSLMDEGVGENLKLAIIDKAVVFTDSNCFNTNFSRGSDSNFLRDVDIIHSSGIGFTYCRWFMESIEVKDYSSNTNPTYTMVLTIQ